MDLLLVDDEPRLAKLLGDTLAEEGHAVRVEHSGPGAVGALAARRFDLVITDLRMEPPDGLELLRIIKRDHPDTEVILLTAFATVDAAVQAMRDGAFDFLNKPVQLDELRVRVRKVGAKVEDRRERERLARENELLRESLGSIAGFEKVIGRSQTMQKAMALAERVAATDATVLLRGESGTGKDVLARAIHFRSARASGPFVKVNCGAIPENLLESELFGHEKGSFTGAVREKPGRFELAHGGSIFLDEVGDITPALQVKILQVLEEKTFLRVGGTQPLVSDCRILSATNRDLEGAIAKREFREDLFYRLNVFPIHLPPLRERGADVALLLEHFLKQHGACLETLSPEARKRLIEYAYPGNVRELENLVQRIVITAGPGPIGVEHLPALAARPAAAGGLDVDFPPGGLVLEDLEKDLILKAIARAQGNKSQAARLLGLTRRTLYSRMERYGLAVGPGAAEPGAGADELGAGATEPGADAAEMDADES
ncbi:MAG: sigma-54-dependent Fis family transcriptional regulator [Candidatus Eisenbacteria bacterium]|nr:sigma-54-dependent Fis family transcriptional regulator [Candidatus Eisenbacteria bacterium]